SPGFLAPELIDPTLLDGGEPTQAVDWWGWAAVLAFAATGRAPYGTGPVGQVLARTRSGEPDLDGLPVRTAAMLHWALSADPADRARHEDVSAALRAQADNPEPEPEEPDDDDLDEPVIDDDAETTVVEPPPGAVTEPEDDEPAGSGYVRPPATPRWGSLLAGAALVAGAGAQWPGRTVLVVLGLLVVVRMVGSDIEAMHTHRMRHGTSVWDVPRAVVSIPWHLVLSVLGLVPAVIVAAAGTFVVGGVTWRFAARALSASDTELVGPRVGVGAGVLVLVFVLFVWFGPLGRTTRVGARRTLAVLAPGPVGARVVVITCLVAALVLFSQVNDGAPLIWSPLPELGLPM
ncbi:MAG: hypothetical protein FWE61_05980, partial [Micrococcales bacterium]|nr:hypothetical protein [Micrococcales bacterium]